MSKLRWQVLDAKDKGLASRTIKKVQHGELHPVKAAKVIRSIVKNVSK